MKKLSIIFVLLSVLSLLSCKKVEGPDQAKLSLSNVEIELITTYSNYTKNAVITADYTYPGPLGELKLLISRSTDMYYAANYSVIDDGQTLTTTVNALYIGDVYYFCVRYYDGIGYNYSDMFSFKVE